MGMLEKIYDNSPICFQNLMCSVKGWSINHRRYNRQFFSELERFEKHENTPDEELKFFLDMSKSIPFYSEIFKVNSDKEGMELIKAFPILAKADVKTHFQELINKECKEPQFLMRTSGTTGGGLVFPYTVKMENRHWAVWWRYRRALGIDFDTWCGWFGGKRIISPRSNNAPYWRINRPGKQVMFSTLHLSNDTVRDYHAEIERRGLSWLHGYPSHLAKFSALAIDNGLKPLTCVKWATTGAENLLGNQEKLMSQMFPNAIIRQHYGLMEGVANISQNREGEWVVDDDFAYVEFIPINENNPNVCRIIGTGFSNPAFPLIRYDTGDIATIEHREDGSIKILSIDGRSSNVLKGPDGFEINEARLSIVLHDFNNIIEAQFHQHSLTEIDLLIVKNKLYNELDEKKLRENISYNFDKRINVRFCYVDEVPRTKSGKLKLVVSDIE